MAKKTKSLGDDARDMAKDLEILRAKKLPSYLERKLMENTDKAFDEEKYPEKNKWQDRSFKYLKQKSDKRDNAFGRENRRGLLVGSGDLRKSIETETSNGQVSIGTDVVYAQIHNEGLEGNAFGKFKFQMPKRQFMPIQGEDLPFQEDVDKWIDDQMDKILG